MTQNEMWFRPVDVPGCPAGIYLIRSYKGVPSGIGPFYTQPVTEQQCEWIERQIFENENGFGFYNEATLVEGENFKTKSEAIFAFGKYAAQLDQQSPAVAVPACWQWVPVEPTPEMIAACENARSYNTSAYMIWKEMIAVAPSNSQHLSPRITEQDALPDGYREEWKRNVMLMWSCVRKHDSSIPSDVLDYIREQLLNKLNAKPESVGG